MGVKRSLWLWTEDKLKEGKIETERETGEEDSI